MRLWVTWRELRYPGFADLARAAGYELLLIPCRYPLLHNGRKPR